MNNEITSQKIVQDQAIKKFFSVHGYDLKPIEESLDGLLLNALCSQDSDGCSCSAEFFILVKDLKTLIRALNQE